LGLSPFGHAGEVVLNRLMAEHGGFDHNRQSLRIVTELERRYPHWPGLNLTWEVREGIVKHETEYDISDASAYDPEKRGHLEAQIANAADELAYTAHDLDDGLRSGLITPADLNGLALWELVRESIGWRDDKLDQLTRHRLIRRLIGLEVNDLVQATHARLETAQVQSVDALQRLPQNVIGWSEEMAQHNKQLKRFLFENLYRHYRVVRMEAKAEKVLSDLFHAYVRRPEQLPPETRKRAEAAGSVARAVCDYLAGMTDRFALDEHYKLFDPYTLP